MLLCYTNTVLTQGKQMAASFISKNEEAISKDKKN
jgi:hypothetical protein